MGILGAKCSQCWDRIPCSCPEQRDRDMAVVSWNKNEQMRLMREQNELLRTLTERKDKQGHERGR
jgi:hypothetical protein